MTDSPFDPYAALGVARGASLEEIEKAYRREAQRAHPDKGGDPARMTDVNMAWKILSDPEMKSRYDAGEDLRKPSLDQKAEGLLLDLLSQVLMPLSAEESLIDCLRMGVEKHQRGLHEARARTYNTLSHLKVKRSRVVGPEDNFLVNAIDRAIAAEEEQLPRYDEDEKTQARALEILKGFSYRTPYVGVLGGWVNQSSTFGVLGSPSG